MKISNYRHIHQGRFAILFILMSVAIVAIACGSDDGGGDSGGGSDAPDGFARISQPESSFNIDQLISAGFKKSKTYDVTGLEEATEAYYGFFGPDPYNRQEFEVRFYPTHQSALGAGVSFADEATGEEAVLLKDVQRWDEGLTQRRQCAGNGGHHSGKCDNAKYGDYVVRGNMVLMCQGKDSKDALENCEALLIAVQSS